MLTDAEIDVVAQNHVGQASDVEVLYCEKRSNPDGIYFIANRLVDRYIGSGGFFVDRVSGEVWNFNSGQLFGKGLDYWLNWYAEGWRPGNYRLIVHDVKDPVRFARLLVKHSTTYLVREMENGVVWRRPVPYDENTVLQRLKTLPCTFGLRAELMSEVLPAVRNGLASVDYAHAGPMRKYSWRPEDNTAEQLGPQWEEPG